MTIKPLADRVVLKSVELEETTARRERRRHDRLEPRLLALPPVRDAQDARPAVLPD